MWILKRTLEFACLTGSNKDRTSLASVVTEHAPATGRTYAGLQVMA
uniref:Uncharacterized protein n=1 Tax=Arundo donax TaxID=35708 RepID=A0A0A9ASY8_ARUDO